MMIMVMKSKGKKPKKAVALISGGIDSVVAAYLIQRQGIEVIPVYCDNSPFTDESTKKRALDVIRQLARVAGKPLKAYIVPNGDTQVAILQNTPRKMTCVFCRRMMLRIAEEIAKKEGAKAVITGEAMGQKASQTLQNLLITTETIKLPVLRPLLGYDKIEIEKTAKEIGTFGLSIQPAVCCTITPERPSTAAKLEEIAGIELHWDWKQAVETAVKKSEIIEIE